MPEPQLTNSPSTPQPTRITRAAQAGEITDRSDATELADPLSCSVPADGRVLIASDLHLGALADPVSDALSTELARRLDQWIGPGLLVLAGDTFELWAEPNNSPAKALRAHPRFWESIVRFNQAANRSVVVVVGNHDGALAWDVALACQVRELLGATLCRAADLEISTGAGLQRIRVEHGNQLDPHNAFLDPCQPGDRPLGLHIIQSVLPRLRASGGATGWLNDVDKLGDGATFPRYIASRMLYRQVARHLRWLAVPVAALGLLRAMAWMVGLVVDSGGSATAALSTVSALGPVLLLGVVADLFLIAVGLSFASKRMFGALNSISLGGSAETGTGPPPKSDPNAAARRRAVQLQTQGYRAFISGHTHRAELIDLGEGFYANTGCNAEILVEQPARAGLPPIYRAARQSTWLELEAGAILRVQVWLAQAFTGSLGALERLAVKRCPPAPARPTAVASLAPHVAWPAVEQPDNGRRTRLIASTAITVTGLVNLLSALTPPLHRRLHHVARVVPFAVPETATFATATVGLILLLLAGGIRRGQRRAWLVAVAVLLAATVSNVAKGLDIEEAAVSLVVAGYLLSRGSVFRGRADPGSTRRASLVLALPLGAAVVAAGTVSRVRHVAIRHVIGAFGGHMLGIGVAPVGRSVQLVSSAITAVALASVISAAWLLLRPRCDTASSENQPDARAWSLIRQHGKGTLDYFALRDDKARYVWQNTVVAYALRRGVAVVSPDPIGPADERAAAWASFRRHAVDNGWSVAVVGAAEDWLATYRASGMTSIYAGDEAVVDVAGFSLDGGRNKGLRQGVNRVVKAGYRVEFHDPAGLSGRLVTQLSEMMGASRRGEVERGFSMTLSRLFDPRDEDLLLAVAFAPDDSVAAFCQYVPATGIDGYSLDVMRRAGGQHPNGLTDFVVVRTIEHLASLGHRGLGLNFATMRAVLAGEVPDTWINRRQRAALRHLGQDMQIESLWRFNAKYDPTWAPRYLVIECPEQILSASLAVASAESLWELPFVGRFMRSPKALAR